MKKMSVLIIFLCSFGLLSAQTAVDYPVNLEKSKLEWDAKKVVGGHVGYVNLKDGAVKLNGDKLEGGSFVIDMPSLVCTDAERVTGHLKNEDFFDVEKFPNATFVIAKVDNANPKAPVITGRLTIKGITNDLSFPATVQVSGNTMNATATVKVNRLDYDIRYRSSNFFADLGNRAIEDEFTMKINLVAETR